MPDSLRPNPDDLLARVQAAERQQSRGRVRIFLGYAAGVGKTYAMLEAAKQRRAEGVDVAVGCVETHGRAETEALLQGLEVLPRRQIEYRGTLLAEMDVDAILARRPQLVLVDELAHTNAPGSRHPKRYQDVDELLATGIDVYTTLNIQHVESLNDVVAQITGVTVRETIPDSVIDEAAEIKLVDIPPEELLQRLQEGKVYVPERAALAIQKFFRQGNLTALREMTLRRTAERVDDQMLAYMQTRAIPGPWAASERLLVCVSPSPLSERLVRAARRLADELKAEWFAVYVETADTLRLSPDQRDRVARTLQLAEELGAKVATVPGQAVADSILEYAQAHNVTKVIAGKPLRSRWQGWLHGSIVDQLIHGSGSIDVYVISGEVTAPPSTSTRAWVPHQPWRRYVASLALVALATLVGRLFVPHLSAANLVMPYLVAVVIAAVYLGRGPAIVASFASVLAFDFFLVPPHLTFAVSDAEYILTFIGLLSVGLVISTLAARARDQAEAASKRATQTAELYDLSRDLAAAFGLDDIVRALIRHVGQTFGRETVLMLPGDASGDRLLPFGSSAAHGDADFALDEQELAVADWVFRHGEAAGRSTKTLTAARLRYLPLKTARGIVGVLGIKGPAEPEHHLTQEQQRLMEAFASQTALAVERAHLDEQARQSQVLQATEKLQTALLNSISHDLRTPLVSITGALSSLDEDGAKLDEATQRGLIENAREEAERLNRLVGNLLDMTRLEAGAMKVRLEPGDVQDAIGSALQQLSTRLTDRIVQIDVPSTVPLVPMDFVLIVQVLVNVLDNALKYSPPDQPIQVQARLAGAGVEIEIADRGMGIPAEDLAYVFDKFYRVKKRGSIGGTGLGLSICKGILEAHGGSIRAENRAGSGTRIVLSLPLEQPEPRTGEHLHE